MGSTWIVQRWTLLLGGALGAAAISLATPAAQAASALMSPVTVQLLAPGGIQGDSTPIAISQSVVDLSAGISAGDASDIGSFMLPGEQITFDGNSIFLHVAAGYADNAGNLSTGYLGSGSEHAQYQFDDLSVPGQKIVGLNVYAFDGYGTSGFSGVLSGVGVALTSPSSVSFDLDDLLFVDRGTGTGNAFGEFRIDLLTAPVPEPAPAALMFVGAIGVLAWSRRAARTSRRH